MEEHAVLWISDLGHPEARQADSGWFEDQWEGRPESRGLESTVGEGGAYVEGFGTVGQEDQDESMKSHIHGRDWWRDRGLKMARLYTEETGHGLLNDVVVQTGFAKTDS